MNSECKTVSADAYMRFLQLARSVQQLPDAPQLDANEKALLEEIALRWFENKVMTVREAQLAVRASTYAQIIAKLPIVQVVPTFVAGLGIGRNLIPL